MGLSYSVEALGNTLFRPPSGATDRNIAKEGVAVAVAYMAASYLYLSVTSEKSPIDK